MIDHQAKLLRQFHRYHSENRLFEKGESLLLAISGGMDSVVMLDLLFHFRSHFELKLAIGHVNHQLRGHESDLDAYFVEELAERYGLPFLISRVEVRGHAQANKLSIESAGRELRYQALDAMRERSDSDSILTAHHGDDQAETVLAHLIRGSGMAGLSGISPVLRLEAGSLVKRPMLPFLREQIFEYAKEQQLTWREDQSNADVTFLRNRIRHELLPFLKSRFNRKVSNHLRNLASIALHADEHLHDEAQTALTAVIREQDSGKIVLDIQELRQYLPIIQSYIVRAVLRQLIDDGCKPTFNETDRILSLLKPSRDPEEALTGRRYLWRELIEIAVDRNDFSFSKLQPSLPVRILEIGKPCLIPELESIVVIKKTTKPGDWRKLITENSQLVDADQIEGEVRFRTFRAGDRFKPLGMRGFKKLSDFFTDLKVPRHQRRQVGLIECDRGIVWICGFRIDERFKIRAQTETVLHMTLMPAS